jgi:hypothetical protein
MDHVDGRVGEQFVQGAVCLGDAQRVRADSPARRAAAQDTADLDPDAAQRFDVDGADEPRPDDGGTDIGDPVLAQSSAPPT